MAAAMAKSPNQKLKLLYLQQILLQRTDEDHPISMEEMRKALQDYNIKAERKSIYSDLEALRLFGVEVEYRRGENGGYYVADRPFELPELKLLVDAVQSSKFITRKKSDALIKKVEGLASAYQARVLQRQVFVTNRIKTMNESIYYNIDKIHAAISSQEKIRFRYFEWVVDFNSRQRLVKRFRHQGNQYMVSPWALTWDDENYYLVAYDSAAGIIKHYRVDKMLEIEDTGEKRDGQELFDRFDMAMYSKKMFGMFGGQEEEVTLQLEKSLAGVAVDRFGRDVFISRGEDEDHFIVRIKAVVSPQFMAWVFGLGERTEIFGPEKVREQFCNYAAGILKQYHKTGGRKPEENE